MFRYGSLSLTKSLDATMQRTKTILARLVLHCCPSVCLPVRHTRGPRQNDSRFERTVFSYGTLITAVYCGQNSRSWVQLFTQNDGVKTGFPPVESKHFRSVRNHNSLRYKTSVIETLITESRIRSFDWDESWWPWMTLNNLLFPICTFRGANVGVTWA